jgi:hypothetical protein
LQRIEVAALLRVHVVPQDGITPRGRGCCALRVISTGKKKARYEWYYQSDIQRRKLHRGKRGRGKVWEVSKPMGDGSYSTKGSKNDISCGPIELSWSAGDYIYLGRMTSRAERNLDVSIAHVESVEKVRLDTLVWLSKRWGQLPYSQAADYAARRRLYRR